MLPKQDRHRKNPDRLTYALVILCFCVFILIGSQPARYSEEVSLHTAPAPTAAPYIRTPEPTAVPAIAASAVPAYAPVPIDTPGLSAHEKAAPPPSNVPYASEEPVSLTYVLNTNTKRFHLPSCRSVRQIREKNLDSFTGTREDLLDMGYIPCGSCHP